MIRPSAMLVPVFELQKFALWMEVTSIITRVAVKVFAAEWTPDPESCDALAEQPSVNQ